MTPTHTIRRLKNGDYEVSWFVAHQLGHRKRRVDYEGALRFAKKHGVAMPDEQRDVA